VLWSVVYSVKYNTGINIILYCKCTVSARWSFLVLLSPAVLTPAALSANEMHLRPRKLLYGTIDFVMY
jgi:hypothetical protein